MRSVLNEALGEGVGRKGTTVPLLLLSRLRKIVVVVVVVLLLLLVEDLCSFVYSRWKLVVWRWCWLSLSSM